MVCITVLHTGNGEYGVMTSAKYDGDPPRSFMNSLERRGSPSIPPKFPLPSFITFYSRQRAVVVVEGATVRPFVTETSTMLVIGLFLSVAG
jgi:hypothetical protein